MTMRGGLLSRALTIATICVFSALAPSNADAQRPAPWYRRAKPIGITARNSPDSVVLTARGTRADSLQISLSFYVGRAVVLHEDWDSSYELVDADSLLANRALLEKFMRARFDSVLASVKREPIDTATINLLGEPKAYRSFAKRPTEQISFHYGYETTVVVAWDPFRGKMVVLVECC